MQIQRTHDSLYLKEDRYEQVKDSFRFVADLAQASGVLARPGAGAADFGCAAGEFLYYLRRLWPDVALTGYDLLPELLDKAGQRVPGVAFVQGSVLDPALAPASGADVTFLVGVHTIFDDFRPVFDNLIGWTRPGGRAYVFTFFNDDPIDVLVKYRHADAAEDAPYESGWNIFSQRSVGRFLDGHPKVKAHTFHPFTIGVDLAKREDDPVRSWTFRDEGGRRLITNGLCLLQKQQALEIVL